VGIAETSCLSAASQLVCRAFVGHGPVERADEAATREGERAVTVDVDAMEARGGSFSSRVSDETTRGATAHVCVPAPSTLAAATVLVGSSVLDVVRFARDVVRPTWCRNPAAVCS
jgi:hypothetical protein